jgi:hypothetical protein
MSAFPLRQESMAAKSGQPALFINRAVRLILGVLFRPAGLAPAWIGVLQRVGLESGVNSTSPGRHSAGRSLARLPRQVLDYTAWAMQECHS